MDLNYLLHRQQVERSRAQAASSEAARKAHLELAQQYEEEIQALTGNRFSIAAAEEAAHGDPVNQDGRRQARSERHLHGAGTRKAPSSRPPCG